MRLCHPESPMLVACQLMSMLSLVRLGFSDEPNPPASSEVAAAMQPYFDSYKLAGVIGIIADKQGKVRYQNLIGYANVEAKTPISKDNVFWIASMSKMFAGASIMMLVDEGKVSLGDPVTKFIPQLNRWMVVEEKDSDHVLLRPPIRPVTIRHLLSHTSGLTGQSEVQQVTGADSTPLKVRALSSVTGPLQWQPGDKYAYGNQGMNIAAHVVEIVSGMPYEDFLQQRFFEPLEMTDTTFWPNDSQIERLAEAYGPNPQKTGYAKGSFAFLTRPLNDRVHRFPDAGGGLFSTTHDILRFGLMLANNGKLDGRRYLSSAAMDELRTEQTGATKVNYSLGYHLRNGLFGHDGALGTDLSVDPSTGMITVFMVQCTSGDQWAARDQFLKAAAEVFKKQLGGNNQQSLEIRKLQSEIDETKHPTDNQHKPTTEVNTPFQHILPTSTHSTFVAMRKSALRSTASGFDSAIDKH